MTTSALMDRRDHLLGAGAPIFYERPVNIVRGEGVWLYDDGGRRYLDMYNNVPCVGHCHPHVVEAMHKQSQTLNVHSRYLNERVLDYAERIANLHADHLTSVVFTCTGTEANEVALGIARAATGGQGFICSDAAYHGNSAEVGKFTRVGQLAGEDRAKEIRAFPFPQSYRPLQEGLSDAELTELYLAKVESAIESLRADGIPLAGMLVCSIFANEGLPAIPGGFMPRAAKIVRAAGGLVIADEVQAGFCRTGRWWGYEETEFSPDIVTMGKPMGNGMPVAAAAASSELVDQFRSNKRYFNTFAASPLQAAAGMAVVDVIEEEELASNVEKVGVYLRGELRKLQASSEQLADVRGRGMFIGMEWVQDRASKRPDSDGAAAVVNRLRDRGFLIGSSGPMSNILKIRPPLVFKREHADMFLTAFEESIRERAVA